MSCLGADVVDLERFRLALSRTPSVRRRLFTPAEQQYGATRNDPAPSLAVRFAAKEAVMKALQAGIGSVRFVDIEVCQADSGAPRLELSGTALRRQLEAGVEEWQVSLSHSETVAFAVVLGEQKR